MMGNQARTPAELALGLIERTAQRVLDAARRGIVPTLELPSRSLENVRYDTASGAFELGSKRKTRALSGATVRTFAQTLRMMALSKEMIESGDFATKREA